MRKNHSKKTWRIWSQSTHSPPSLHGTGAGTFKYSPQLSCEAPLLTTTPLEKVTSVRLLSPHGAEPITPSPGNPSTLSLSKAPTKQDNRCKILLPSSSPSSRPAGKTQTLTIVPAHQMRQFFAFLKENISDRMSYIVGKSAYHMGNSRQEESYKLHYQALGTSNQRWKTVMGWE